MVLFYKGKALASEARWVGVTSITSCLGLDIDMTLVKQVHQQVHIRIAGEVHMCNTPAPFQRQHFRRSLYAAVYSTL